ncbi:hypothetical protein L195_g041073 [Trifolium pratense]|uniref:Uncharacterized protein n=1 Tax=Trifolium pratense TaxID=57577 RepID=A0A2K3KBY3_TRIPR|nr:hypothetical protein L195_g061805 [Trifolium pratense]PNX70906.1 hypothetical protein L195_g057862 [Trifolium pratense]PNX85008.1 hypothetical protein L195_g041073 [Trifolium pratense]
MEWSLRAMGYWMTSSCKAESEPILVVVFVLRRNEEEEWDLKKKGRRKRQWQWVYDDNIIIIAAIYRALRCC